jgi:hypothetical protein
MHYTPGQHPHHESGSALGWTGVITGAVTGVSNTILDWMDAFCATEACAEAQKNREASVRVAELNKEAADAAVIAAGVRYKSGLGVQKTATYLGFGALGLGAIYLLTR